MTQDLDNPRNSRERKPVKHSIKLTSHLGLNYTRLDNFLAENQWRDADQETGKQLLAVIGKERWGDAKIEDIKNVSKEDLQIIDSLWRHYSNGKFGFSSQTEVWMICGGTPGVYNRDVRREFGDRIGWKKEGTWLSYCDLTFDISAPTGHLPRAVKSSRTFTPWAVIKVLTLGFALDSIH